MTAIDFPGEYCVTITNPSNCETTACYFVNQAGGENSLQAMTSSTCYGANEGTIALSNVSDDLSFQWDNGATSYELSGLDAGQYCVTVTSANCADISQCFEIAYACCSEININLTVSAPSSCNANDGGITTYQGGTIDGAIDPVTYIWNTGHTGSTLENLGPGFYSLTVTDAIGCTGSENWDLTIEDFATSVVVQPACENIANGVGIVIASNNGDTNNPTGDFKFAWPDGFTTEGGVVSTRADLVIGNYSLTITDVSSTPPCNIVVDLTVGETPISGPFDIQPELTNSCANTETGAINITPSGGNEPYEYHWSNGSTFKDLNNVAAGTYYLTIQDVCDREIIQSFVVNSFTAPIVELADFGGCNGDGWAQVTVTHDYIYELEWQNANTTDGLYLERIHSQFPPTYVLTDENGCTFTDVLNINLGSSFTDINVVGSCQGLAQGIIEGIVGVEDLSQPLIVKINQATYTFTPDANPFFLSIGGLEPGSKKVSIINGNCHEVFDITIENLIEEGDVALALHFDEDLNQFFCEYARSCEEDDDLPNFLEPASIDFLENRSSCSFPVFCGEEDMDTKNKFKKKKLKARVFIELLQAIQLQPQIINNRLPPGLISQRIAEFNVHNPDDCDGIRYCPLNFQILDVINNPSASSLGYTVNSGCPTIVCDYGNILGLFDIVNIHNDFCFQNENMAEYLGLNTTIDIENFNTNFLENDCYLQTNRLIEIWYAYQAGNLDYLENLASTEIFNDIILEHQTEFENGVQYLNCSYVRWCANDGNINDINYLSLDDCQTIVPYAQQLTTCDIQNGVVYCFDPYGFANGGNISAYILNDNIGPKNFQGKSQDTIYDHHIVNLTNEDDFRGFTSTINLFESGDTSFFHTNYNYIRETYYGMEYVDFNTKTRINQSNYLQEKVEQIYSNDFLEQDIYIHSLDDFTKFITITDGYEDDFLEVAHQGIFEIVSVDQFNNSVEFYIYHNANLNINGVEYPGDVLGTISMVRFNLLNNEITTTAMHHIKRNSLFVNKHNNQKTQINLFFSGDLLYSNDFTIPTNLESGIYILNYSDNQQIPNNSLENLVILNGTFDNISALDYYDSQMLAFVIKGIGSLQVPEINQNLFLNNTYSYVAIDLDKPAIFHKTLPKTNLEQLTAVQLSNDPIAGFGFSISFSEIFRMDTFEYNSTGNQDLLFKRFDSFGNIMQEQTWGKAGAAINSKEFVLTPFSALFGGRVMNASDNIVIGNQKFIYHDQFTNHSFMASQALKNNSTFKGKTKAKNNIAKNEASNIKIFPNPTKEKISIIFSEFEQPNQCTIYSSSGSLTKQFLINKEKQINISLNDYPTGVYIIQLSYADHSTFHKVIMIK